MKSMEKDLEKAWEEGMESEEGSHCTHCLNSFKIVDTVKVCDLCSKEACENCRCNCNNQGDDQC